MALNLHHLRCREGDARTSRAAARHPIGLCEKSILVDRQNLTVPHDDTPINHGVPDVAAARAVDECLLRIEERREMRLPGLHRDQVGSLSDLDGSRLGTTDRARSFFLTEQALSDRLLPVRK